MIQRGDDVRFTDHQFLGFTSAEHGVFRLLSVIEASALNVWWPWRLLLLLRRECYDSKGAL
ncbi:TPA: hypothetical protein F3L15_22805 [Aeromonas hydrophila]|nr:hypothetical protein [Aeromonas hydrophila]